jgi:hypothetical protein
MQNKKQATKQMGCEGKKTIIFYSISEIHYMAPMKLQTSNATNATTLCIQ